MDISAVIMAVAALLFYDAAFCGFKGGNTSMGAMFSSVGSLCVVVAFALANSN